MKGLVIYEKQKHVKERDSKQLYLAKTSLVPEINTGFGNSNGSYVKLILKRGCITQRTKMSLPSLIIIQNR